MEDLLAYGNSETYISAIQRLEESGKRFTEAFEIDNDYTIHKLEELRERLESGETEKMVATFRGNGQKIDMVYNKL